MIRTLTAAAALILVAAGAQAQQDFRWSGRIARGDEIQIKNVVGDVRAEPTSGDEVVVTATRRGPDADRIHIEVVRRDGATVVCAIYPHDDDDDGGWTVRNSDGDDGEPRDACNPRHMSVHHNSGSVEFVVRVPAGVRLAASSVSGNVYAERLHSPVRASSVSGNVHVSTDGPVKASSVSGDIDALVSRLSDEPLEFTTVSGDVTLNLPRETDADLQVRTLSGDIDSDFPLTIGATSRRRDDNDGFVRVNVQVGHDMRAQIGRGGTPIKVHTVSGDISIRKS